MTRTAKESEFIFKAHGLINFLFYRQYICVPFNLESNTVHVCVCVVVISNECGQWNSVVQNFLEKSGLFLMGLLVFFSVINLLQVIWFRFFFQQFWWNDERYRVPTCHNIAQFWRFYVCIFNETEIVKKKKFRVKRFSVSMRFCTTHSFFVWYSASICYCSFLLLLLHSFCSFVYLNKP